MSEISKQAARSARGSISPILVPVATTDPGAIRPRTTPPMSASTCAPPRARALAGPRPCRRSPPAIRPCHPGSAQEPIARDARPRCRARRCRGWQTLPRHPAETMTARRLDNGVTVGPASKPGPRATTNDAWPRLVPRFASPSGRQRGSRSIGRTREDRDSPDGDIATLGDRRASSTVSARSPTIPSMVTSPSDHGGSKGHPAPHGEGAPVRAR